MLAKTCAHLQLDNTDKRNDLLKNTTFISFYFLYRLKSTRPLTPGCKNQTYSPLDPGVQPAISAKIQGLSIRAPRRLPPPPPLTSPTTRATRASTPIPHIHHHVAKPNFLQLLLCMILTQARAPAVGPKPLRTHGFQQSRSCGQLQSAAKQGSTTKQRLTARYPHSTNKNPHRGFLWPPHRRSAEQASPSVPRACGRAAGKRASESGETLSCKRRHRCLTVVFHRRRAHAAKTQSSPPTLFLYVL